MKELLILYGANVISSMLYNTGVYYKLHRDARKKTMRKLKYKDDISKTAKKELKNIRRDFRAVSLEGILQSFIPFKNIFYTMETIDNYDAFKEDFESDYEEIVESANEKEELARQIYLETLRLYKDDLLYIDEKMAENLKDDNYRPSRKEFVKTLKYLNPDTEIK